MNLYDAYTPENERIHPPKKGTISIGNASEPTIDFQGTFVSFSRREINSPAFFCWSSRQRILEIQEMSPPQCHPPQKSLIKKHY